MNPKTFKKQLLEALEKPDDWHLANGHLTHRGTGIWMLGDAINSSATSVCVFAPNGPPLLTLPFCPDEATDCYRAVQRRNREAQEESNDRRRRAFLNGFEGFEK